MDVVDSAGPDAASLSVVVPTHDTRDLTLRCLAAVERAAPDAEVVVVDDASSDGTAEAVAAAHPRTRLLRLSAAAGFTRAANLGLAAAGGAVLLLLNSDTEVDAAGIAAARRLLAAEPRVGAVGASLHYPDGSPQWSGGREPTLPWLLALASGVAGLLGRLPLYRHLKPPGARGLAAVEWVTGAAMALRRSAWRQAGPFDEDFRFYAQDLDLCTALRQKGWWIVFLPNFRVLHHHGATIGRSAGAAGGRQHIELLWSDLLLWAVKWRGPAWARRAAAALGAGARLRLLARALALPFLPAARRASWRNESGALRRALVGLGRVSPE